jgi:Spy/CpxP family protein refolding chaperone
MRLFGKLVLGLGLVALVAPSALAQGPRGGGFGGGGGAMLLSNKSVQQELKLDAEQVEKATKLSDEQRTKMREAREKLQDLSQEERQTKMRETMMAANEESHKAIASMLKPEQEKRFHQISLQQRGVNAFSDAKVQGQIKITDEQKTKLADIAKELGDKRREVMQENQGDFAAAREKLAPINKEAHEKAAALLSDDQKAIWKEMLGAPFEVKYEPRPQQ